MVKAKKTSGKSNNEHTPLMRQWIQLKQQCGSLLLFFRVGDFYELFWEDAEQASRLLDITLTRRGESAGKPVIMSGVPWHALDTHLARLIKLGVGAAVADQMGDPSKSIGPVDRAIVRIVTPGTLVDDALLSDRRDAPLLSVYPDNDQVALFWVNLSSGEARFLHRPMARLMDDLEWINPAEILTPEGFDIQRPGSMLTHAPAWHFDAARGQTTLSQSLQTNQLIVFGLNPQEDTGILSAASAALEHIKISLGGKTPQLSRLIPIQEGAHLSMDASTRKSLEIDKTIKGEDQPTLVSCLDQCSTSMGSRRLRDWIGAPLTSLTQIQERHAAVALLMGEPGSTVLKALMGYPDTERAGARAATLTSRPRDFFNLRQAFQRLPDIIAPLQTIQSESSLLQRLVKDIVAPPALLNFLEKVIADDPSVHIRDGGVIASGYHASLDELRSLASGAEASMQAMEERERLSTGIPTLRLDFNRAHGFSIEITRLHSDKIPAHYTRKMTLKNTERYTTPELIAFEHKVLTAKEQALALEKQLFEEAQVQLSSFASDIARMSYALSCLDCLCSFAQLSFERDYCRPVYLPGTPQIQAQSLRHAVAEQFMSNEFIPNDAHLHQDQRDWVITGPNMGGKSTYMRSLALACIMGQAGCFVPAQSFQSTVLTDIFARVGASDDISRGQSTFMVEMTEAATILHRANPSSLCIIDEIGRGTSTFDGMSLAWAILKHLHDVNRSLCLFSTHYFEITDLAERLTSCKNAHISASLEGGTLRFLRQLLPGAASQSHGIDVAQLAGVPSIALKWSKEMLKELESAEFQLKKPHTATSASPVSPALTIGEELTLEALKNCQPDQLSPKEALEMLYQLKKELTKS